MTNAIKPIAKLQISELAGADETRKEAIQELTGCTHVYVIEGRCEEPGCHNNIHALLAGPHALGEALDEIPKPITNAQSRRWCVL